MNHHEKPQPTLRESSLKNLAEKRALILIGCYRKSDAADPEIYARAVVATLMRWPPEIIVAVTEPATGIPSRIKWLPSIAEIVEACEDAAANRKRLEKPAGLLPEPQRQRPSEAELDAQFARLGLSHLRPGSKFDPR